MDWFLRDGNLSHERVNFMTKIELNWVLISYLIFGIFKGFSFETFLDIRMVQQ